MGHVILPKDLDDGTTALSQDVMDNFAAILAAINGGLDASNFVAGAPILPVGSILPYGGAVAPNGFLLADGAVISRTNYAALFAVFGTTFNVGGEPGTDFRLPDLRGRSPMGPDGSAGRIGSLPDTLGAGGGAERHTLSSAELAAHAHGVNDPGHNHNPGTLARSGQFEAIYDLYVSGAGFGGNGIVGGSNSGILGPIQVFGTTVGTGISIQNAGGGSSHNNVHPYQVVNWIVKT